MPQGAIRECGAAHALERVTRYEHDAAGRRTARVLPMLQRESFGYTVTGALNQHVDFLGRPTAHAIDDDTDRISTTDLPSISGPENVTFEYYGDGTRRSVTEDGQETAYTREALRGQLASVARPGVPLLSYGHHPESGERIGAQTADDSTDVTYEHDASGRLWKVREQGVLRATYTWDAAGRVSRLVYGETAAGELEGAWDYDELTGAVETITWKLPGLGGAEILKLEYELDDTDPLTSDEEGSGRRTGVTETWSTGPARRIDYTFDELHRLTDEEELRDGVTRHVEYEYDDVGNRLRRTLTVGGALVEDISYTYDENDRLLSAGGTTYEWDGNGNLTWKDSTDFDWDDRDRLTGTEGWVFEYDVDGLKQSSDPPVAEITRHVVDTTFPYAQVLEDRGPSGITNYLRGLKPIRLTRGGQSWWYLHDALGSTRALVPTGGATAPNDEWDYEAFGEEIRRVGTTENRWQFAGEERREEIDLDYLRARWMDPAVGRFASRDTWEGRTRRPVGRAGYGYVEQSPVMFVDPSGHMSVGEFATAAAIGAVIGGMTTAMTQHALGEPVTLKAVLVGAAVGGALGPAAIALPELGLVLGIVSINASGHLVREVFINPASTPVQKIEATALLLGSIGGTYIGARYLESARPALRGKANAATWARYNAIHERSVANLVLVLQKMGVEVVGTRLTVKTPFGLRQCDIVTRDAGGRLHSIEVKSTRAEFGRTRSGQFVKDTWIREFGGEFVGDKARVAGIEGVRVVSVTKIAW